jgi:hypothetical protein
VLRAAARAIFGTPNDWRGGYLADELILSFVPDAEQRLWRTMSRTKYQPRRERVLVQNQLESLLEEVRIKLFCNRASLQSCRK